MLVYHGGILYLGPAMERYEDQLCSESNLTSSAFSTLQSRNVTWVPASHWPSTITGESMSL